MKTLFYLLLGSALFMLNGCCAKQTCPVETTISEITFYNFQPGDLDAINIVEYAKADTALRLPTDSFVALPERRPGGDEISIPLPKALDTAHNYLVRLIRINKSYKITGLEMEVRQCASGCKNQVILDYQTLGQYFVNGSLKKSDRIQLYK